MSCKIECESSGIDVEAYHTDISLPRPDPSTNTLNCRIGVDKKSGRIKWCPDCRFVKFLLILPVVLLPVIVAFVLIMRLSATFKGSIQFHPVTERIQIYTDLEPYHRTTRDVNELNSAQINHNCEIIRHLAIESFDIHDKELFRDIRTSFIPSEMCMWRNRNRSHEIESAIQSINNIYDAAQTNQSKSVDQLKRWINKYADPIDFNRLNSEHGELNFRHRRQIDDFIPAQNITIESSSETESDSGEDIDGAKKTEQFRDQKTKESNDDKPLEIPAFLRTFWQGGKTYEQIRSSQVDIIKQYMDESVDPCDDFYQYACKNWNKLNPIPNDKAAYDTFEMLREILDIELNSLLSENKATDMVSESDTNVLTPDLPLSEVVDSPNSFDFNTINTNENVVKNDTINPPVCAEQKAKFLYKSCMNSEILERRQLEPLYELLETLGGWPVIDGDKFNASKFDWLELAAKLRLYNNDVFIMQWVGPDIKNSDENIIQFDQNSLGLPSRDYFIKSSNSIYLDAYQEFAKQVMHLCGASENESAKTANDIIEFEIELAKIMASPQDRINVTQLYRRMTVGTLYDYVPDIDWKRYLEIVLERKIERSEVVVMFALNFMQDLVLLLDSTEPKTIANYMLWKFVRHRINSLDDRFQDAKQQFYNILIGRKKSPPRWKTCVNQVNSNMGMAV